MIDYTDSRVAQNTLTQKIKTNARTCLHEVKELKTLCSTTCVLALLHRFSIRSRASWRCYPSSTIPLTKNCAKPSLKSASGSYAVRPRNQPGRLNEDEQNSAVRSQLLPQRLGASPPPISPWQAAEPPSMDCLANLQKLGAIPRFQIHKLIVPGQGGQDEVTRVRNR